MCADTRRTLWSPVNTSLQWDYRRGRGGRKKWRGSTAAMKRHALSTSKTQSRGSVILSTLERRFVYIGHAIAVFRLTLSDQLSGEELQEAADSLQHNLMRLEMQLVEQLEVTCLCGSNSSM